MFKRLILYLFILGSLIGCTKKILNEPELLVAQDYFPLVENSYWIYHATFISIDAAVNVFDTLEAEIKMMYIAYDDSLKHHRLERFIREDSLSDWTDYDVILVSWDDISMQWVENNYRYVKLTDPVYENKSWDGNIYNILEEWDYYYSNLKRTFELNDLSYANTITIEKRDIKNVIQEKRAFEVLALGVGTIYDYNAEFTFQAGVVDVGSSREFELIKYGLE